MLSPAAVPAGLRAAVIATVPATLFAALVAAVLAAALAAPAGAQLVPRWLDPSRILVIHDTSWPDADGDGTPDSTEVALHYAARRGVPSDRLLGLPLTPAGTGYPSSQWALFLAEMRDPLIAWLDAHGHDSIDTLLFCYGVPYEVDVPGHGLRSVDSSLCVPWSLGTVAAPSFKPTHYQNPMKETSPHIGEDVGHFDPALHVFQGLPMYQHCRLDGLSAEHAKALVDRAVYAQRHVSLAPGGYSGLGYVDTRFGAYSDAFLAGYPFGYASYQTADQNMAYAKIFVEQSGFPLRWEAWETEIGEPGATFTDGSSAAFAAEAMFYGGWYNFAKYQHAWQWKTGAFACDLNSNSAQGLRAPGTASFLCQAFQENLTAGAGVIAEPYLNGHNRPDILLAYMLDGFPWAEAAMISDPGLKWMSLHVGDPLFRHDLASAVPDLEPPAPFLWLGADHASLELELPAVPAAVPGDPVVPGYAEVFRCTAVASAAGAALVETPIAQPDDRRLQRVAVPPTGAPGLTWAAVSCVDPAGNAATTPVVHFLAGPQPVASAHVAVDDADLGAGESLVLRFSLGAAGGLLTSVSAFSMTATLPDKGLTGLHVEPLLLPLLGGPLVDRAVTQANFSVVFGPGVWPDGPATIEVSLTAGGQTAAGSVDFLVGR